MTDSGGYQVLEYGDVDVSPEEMGSLKMELKQTLPFHLINQRFWITKKRG